MIRAYHENSYWSVAHGCRVARLSMADSRGQEYYAIVIRESSWRGKREAALERLAAAIERGDGPGEVET